MNINEIAEDILKQENNQLAQAFTMVVASLLLSKNIQPIINKSLEEWDENDDLNKYIIRKTYNVTFDIDTSEHDEKIKNEAFEEFAEWLVKYNVIRGGAMGELLRDFKCVKGYKQ